MQFLFSPRSLTLSSFIFAKIPWIQDKKEKRFFQEQLQDKTQQRNMVFNMTGEWGDYVGLNRFHLITAKGTVTEGLHCSLVFG